MLSVEEQRTLHRMERGLLHDDPRFALRLIRLRIGALWHRRSARVCLALEASFLVIAAFGAVLGEHGLVALGASAAAVLPFLALSCRQPVKPPDAPRGTPPKDPPPWF